MGGNNQQSLKRQNAALRKQLAEIKQHPHTPAMPAEPTAARTAMMVQFEQRMTHVGPVPAPWILSEYEKIDPGRASKLFDLAESQARHRMELEAKVIGGDSWRSWSGLAVAAVISIGGLWLAFYMTQLGQAEVAAVLMATVVGADLTAFIIGRSGQRKEREEKSRAMGKKR